MYKYKSNRQQYVAVVTNRVSLDCFRFQTQYQPKTSAPYITFKLRYYHILHYNESCIEMTMYVLIIDFGLLDLKLRVCLLVLKGKQNTFAISFSVDSFKRKKTLKPVICTVP